MWSCTLTNYVAGTIQRHQGLYQGKSGYGNAYLWVYCNEDSFWFSQCTKGDNPPSAIVAYEQEDIFFNNWYITFCPQFYKTGWTIPLKKLRKDLEDDNPDPSVMESYAGPPVSQAEIFFHETMHMSQLVTSPQANDYAYGAEKVYNLARNRNTDAAVYNADSWTMTAIAIWAQQTFDLANPPKPAAKQDAGPITLSSNVSSEEGLGYDVLYVDSQAVTPQGAKPVPSGQSYFVDETLWEIQDAAGGTPPTPSTASATSTASPTGSTAAAPSCSHVGDGCQCTDGSTPSPDEDNRCCLWNQPDGNDQCFGDSETGTISLATPLPTATAPATTTGPPSPSCSHVGAGCQCSDGSTPTPDEDNRCCLWNQPDGDQCFP